MTQADHHRAIFVGQEDLGFCSGTRIYLTIGGMTRASGLLGIDLVTKNSDVNQDYLLPE